MDAYNNDDLTPPELININSQAFLQIYSDLMSSQLSVSQSTISAPSPRGSQLFSQIPDSQKMTIHKRVNEFRNSLLQNDENFPEVSSSSCNTIRRVVLDMTKSGERLYHEDGGGTIVIPCKPHLNEITLHYPNGTEGRHSLGRFFSCEPRRKVNEPLGDSSQNRRKFRTRRSAPRVHKTPRQRAILIESFERDQFPTPAVRESLCLRTGLTDAQVRLWFQHQRNIVSKEQGKLDLIRSHPRR